jgi:hypothetical protein
MWGPIKLTDRPAKRHFVGSTILSRPHLRPRIGMSGGKLRASPSDIGLFDCLVGGGKESAWNFEARRRSETMVIFS